MTNSLDNLFICADYVQDHFRRLGGSNQYSGFMNWHIPAFLLSIYQNKTESEILPSAIWGNTKDLQDATKSRLLSTPPTKADIAEFIDKTTKQTLKFKDKRENLEWIEFCKSNVYL
ncbi:MAG: hypothetical protein WCP61_09770 [Chitinophagia bacterium]